MSESTTFEEILENKGQLVWTNVGISMMPMLREKRDVMIIEKSPDGVYKKLDAVLFVRDGIEGRGKYVLHRILRVNSNGTYWIVGDNCTSGETVRGDHILGILTYVVRNGKKISTKDKKYLLYVHLWCDLYPVRFFLLKARSKSLRMLSAIKHKIFRILRLEKPKETE